MEELKNVMLRYGDNVDGFQTYLMDKDVSMQEHEYLINNAKSVPIFVWLIRTYRNLSPDFQAKLVCSHLDDPEIIKYIVENSLITVSKYREFRFKILRCLNAEADPEVCMQTFNYFMENNILTDESDSPVNSPLYLLIQDNGHNIKNKTVPDNMLYMIQSLLHHGYKLNIQLLIKLIVDSRSVDFVKFLIDTEILDHNSGFNISHHKHVLANKLIASGNDPTFWMLVQNGILSDTDGVSFLINLVLQIPRSQRDVQGFKSYVGLLERLLKKGFKYDKYGADKWLEKHKSSRLDDLFRSYGIKQVENQQMGQSESRQQHSGRHSEFPKNFVPLSESSRRFVPLSELPRRMEKQEKEREEQRIRDEEAELEKLIETYEDKCDASEISYEEYCRLVDLAPGVMQEKYYREELERAGLVASDIPSQSMRRYLRNLEQSQRRLGRDVETESDDDDMI